MAQWHRPQRRVALDLHPGLAVGPDCPYGVGHSSFHFSAQPGFRTLHIKFVQILAHSCAAVYPFRVPLPRALTHHFASDPMWNFATPRPGYGEFLILARFFSQ